ncbi:MAG: LLM class F420-dependent oxidoreductase [Actinobacteria bacterium]|nr:LLM class F420-dependent oxidoreductase [Actinomycetota bacterium]
MDLTGTGIWSSGLRYGDAAQAADAAAELDELGYTAVWIPDVGGDVFAALVNLLGATTRMVVATGILNLWMHTPAETASARAELLADHPGRLMLGLGVSHAPLIDSQEPGRYRKPLTRMREYLDELDAAAPPVPRDERVLAALGPKMLELARERARGAHPYLAPPVNTARARATLGDGPLLCPEQPVVLEADPSEARRVARFHLATYLGLPNYDRNHLRNGFTEDDLRNGGSDRLVDHLVAWGDEEAVRARVQEHRDAGADHVCVQVLTDDRTGLPRDAWRRLAPALGVR